MTTPTGGTVLSTPYHGVVSFDAPQIHATGLPDGDKVAAGQPVTATVRVTNTGPGTRDVFADPRLAKESETDSLLPLFAPAKVALPGTNVPSFLVPTQTDAVLGAAQGSAPIVLEMGYGELGEGDPDLIGVSRGNNAASAYSGPPRAVERHVVPRPGAARAVRRPGLRLGDRRHAGAHEGVRPRRGLDHR